MITFTPLMNKYKEKHFMMPNDLKKAEVREFEHKLEFFLRSTGRLFPITPAQVEAFEKHTANGSVIELPEMLRDPLAILERGYITYARGKSGEIVCSEPEKPYREKTSKQQG